MDFESLKWLATLGVGGIIAGIVFLAYRKDFLQERANARSREDKLIAVVEKNAQVSSVLAQNISGLSATLERTDREQGRRTDLILQAVMRRGDSGG